MVHIAGAVHCVLYSERFIDGSVVGMIDTIYRWIAYTSQNIPGNQSFELDRFTSLADARDHYIEFCSGVGTDQCTMTLYFYVDDDMWNSAVEYENIGCPFDYADRVIERGPRGGVVITRC